MKKYFYVDDSPVERKYIVFPNHPILNPAASPCGFAVLGARIFGMKFHDYLRMCRDVYGAVIMGKNNYFPCAYFSNKEDAQRLADELNLRTDKLKHKK